MVEAQTTLGGRRCLQITRRRTAGVTVSSNGVVGELAAVATGIGGDQCDVFADG